MAKKKEKGKKDKGKKGKGKKSPKSPRALDESEVKKKEEERKKALYQNTYKLVDKIRFKSYEIEDQAYNILQERLCGKSYNPQTSEEDCQTIANQISEVISKKPYKHFKHVVLVTIGSVKERPVIYLSSKCLWNDRTDSYTTIRFHNSSLYAVVMIYGLYHE